MRGFLARLAITALGFWAADALIQGLHVRSWQSLLLAALLLGVVNAVIRPLVVILTFPLTVLTLGLFLLVVNGISVALVAWLLPGVTVTGLMPATLAAIVVWLVSWVGSGFIGGSGRVERLRGVEVTGRRLDG
jgi:putative membrane protein